jgi:TonB family protein
MEAIATYLFRSSVWLTGFALVYILFLRNERFFTLNRFFLVFGILASIGFPFFTWHYTVIFPMIPSAEVSEPTFQETVSPESEPFSTGTILLLAYLSGMTYLLYRLIKQTLSVWTIIRKSKPLHFNSAKLIHTNRYPASFSFFSFVFVNPSIDETETKEIVNHEQEHIRQRHWIDLLLFEILCTIQWFNPAIWLYGRFIRQNHEYLADEAALQRTSNPAIYRAALLNQMFGGPVISLANSFNYSINKKRFTMMKHTIQSPFRKLKLLLVLPLIAGVFYAFAAPEYQFVQAENNKFINDGKTVTGKVTDDKGEALPGASVVVSGKLIGTQTDINGNFKLEFADDSPIVISFVGFDSQKLTPDFSHEMVIQMKPIIIAIEETGNVTSLSDPEKEPSIIKTTTESGDIKLQTDSPLKFRSTDGSGKKPLIVKDGVIVDNQNVDNIPPETIESISVLKNQSATALFGDRGKDGVILITTKNAGSDSQKATQKFTIGYNSNLKGKHLDGSDFGNLNKNNGGYSFNEKKPLIVINRKIIENQNIDNIDPETINSVNILKDASILEKYGNTAKNGVLEIATKSPNETFFIVEEMPEFPGGFNALKEYVASSMQYPAIALENGIIGQVYVNFVVAQDGSVNDAKIARGVDPSLDKEALRIVNNMPKWKPGSQAGKNIRVSYSMPIKFSTPVDYHPKSKEKLRETRNSTTKATYTKSRPDAKESKSNAVLDQSAQTFQLIIVPNPTKDKATITLAGSDSNKKLDVTIYDTDGKLIKKESKNRPSFSLSFASYVSGTYLIVASDGKNKYSGHLIVNH